MSKQSKKSNKTYRNASPSGNIRPSKSLGQNFLIDEEAIWKIVEGSEVDKDTLVIEIGPGPGALTCPLAEQAGRVVAIELDERMIEPLRVKTIS